MIMMMNMPSWAEDDVRSDVVQLGNRKPNTEHISIQEKYENVATAIEW